MKTTPNKNEHPQNKPDSEHIRAEVESLRSMLHRWLGITTSDSAESQDDTQQPKTNKQSITNNEQQGMRNE